MLTLNRLKVLIALAISLATAGVTAPGIVQAQSNLNAVNVPSLSWTKIAEVSLSGLGRVTYLRNDPDPTKGLGLEQSITGLSTLALENDTSAQILQLCEYTSSTGSCTQNTVTAANFARSVKSLPANMPFVLGAYAPLNAMLVVDAYKVARARSTNAATGSREIIGLYHASFTPAHGNYWVAAKTYEDNPFARFAYSATTGTCPVNNPAAFCSIGMDGAEVAIGHAMRLVGAPIGILAVATPVPGAMTVTTTGDLTNEIVSVLQTYSMNSTWYIAAPSAFQPNGGTSASICVDSLCTETAPSMAVFSQWSGGSLSSTNLYPNPVNGGQPITVSSSSGNIASPVSPSPAAFTYFAQTLAATPGFSQTITEANTSAGVVLTNLESQSSPLAGPLMAAQAAGFTAVTSSTSTMTVPQLPQGLQSTNPSLSAAGGSATVVATTRGTASMASAQDPLSQALLATDATMVAPAVNGASVGYGFNSVNTYAYGNCSAGSTSASCAQASQIPGNLPRTDAYSEVDMRAVYQDTPSN